MTREAIRVPSTGTGFRWRVSLAQIEAPGPFSDFAGYQRKMVLLRGSGLRLIPRHGEPLVLRAPGELVEFDGAVPMDCELLDGPCTDLNLMVSTSIGAQAWVQPLTERRPLDASVSDTLLLLPVSGTLTIVGTDVGSVSLNAWDLALISPGEVLSVEPAAGRPTPLVFFATVADNPR